MFRSLHVVSYSLPRLALATVFLGGAISLGGCDLLDELPSETEGGTISWQWQINDGEFLNGSPAIDPAGNISVIETFSDQARRSLR